MIESPRVPRITQSMTTTHFSYQSNAWVGLPSLCSTSYCVLSLLPHLRVQSPRTRVRGGSLIILSVVTTHISHQSNAWVGLSSLWSTPYCVLSLPPHLRVQSPRTSVRGGSLIIPSMVWTHVRYQSNAWLGLSSLCSTLHCMLPLLPHLGGAEE